MPHIKLSAKQYAYLRKASFLPVATQQILKSLEFAGSGRTVLKVTVSEAAVIRDALGVQLQKFGFDDAYKLTADGQVIEELIDALYFD